MKNILKTIISILCLLLITTFSSCEKDLYEDGIKSTSEQNQNFSVSILEGKDAKSLQNVVETKIDNYRAANRGSEVIDYGVVNYDQVMKIVDNLGNKTYMFRVEHPDATFEKFFNMVLQKKVDGSSFVKLFEYTMTPEFAEKYYNGEKKMKDFEGTYSYKLLAHEVLDLDGYHGDDEGGGGGSGGGVYDGNTGTPTGGTGSPGGNNGSNNNSGGVGTLEPGNPCPPCPQGGGPLNGSGGGGAGGGSGGSGSGGSGTHSSGSGSCFIMSVSMQKRDTATGCDYDIYYIYVDCGGPHNRSIEDASPCPPCNSGNNGVAIFEPINAPGMFNNQLNAQTASPNAYNIFSALDPHVKYLVNDYISHSALSVSQAVSFFATLYTNHQLTWFSQQPVATQINILNYGINNQFSSTSQTDINTIINVAISYLNDYISNGEAQNIVDDFINSVTNDDSNANEDGVSTTPPSCESFNFVNTNSNWQEAAVQNIHFQIVIVTPQGYHFSNIIEYPQPILFGTPKNLLVGGTIITSGMAASLSSQALWLSMNETVKKYGDEPVSELMVKLYFESRLKHNYPLFIPGGRVNFNPTSLNVTPTQYQTNLFNTGDCN